MTQIWNSLLAGLGSILQTFHSFMEPIFGDFAWGWAIILLTFFVRLLLVPLAVKQTRSMRAMQRLAPQVKKIQAKYKVDRSLMRTDPQRYKEMKQKAARRDDEDLPGGRGQPCRRVPSRSSCRCRSSSRCSTCCATRRKPLPR